MFALRRIFRNNKQLTNYICTSGILKSGKPKKGASSLFRSPSAGGTHKPKKKATNDTSYDVMSALRPPEKVKKKKHFREALASAADDVAKELKGDEKQTKKDLLEYIKALEVTTEVQKPEEGSYPLGEGYLPEGGTPQVDTSQSHFEEFPNHGRRRARARPLSFETEQEKFSASTDTAVRFERPIKPFKGLNISKKSIMKSKGVELKIWNELVAEELAATCKRPPENFYQEMIKWTNEGRLWTFPIDNDQGMEREAATSFTEHVFLDKYLEPWCPEKGPLRKFMSMVLIGLSKNPYLTVGEKRRHILWFKHYFEEKKKLLQELGAMGPTKLEVSKEEQTS